MKTLTVRLPEPLVAETLPDPIILTTDADFRIYRRHSRHVVPCVTPN